MKEPSDCDRQSKAGPCTLAGYFLTTTTDGEYTPPDITTTTMTSTELTSTTNISSSDLGPTIMIDVIDSDDDEKSESLIGGIVEAIGSMVQSLSCYFTEC